MKLLHTGDLHLGTPFGTLPEPQARQRRQEQPELLRRIVRLAREEQVDVTLLAGDLFDTPRPERSLVEETAALLSQLPGRIFLTPGNHDYLIPGGPYDAPVWPQQMTIFRSRTVERVALPELNAAVWGAAFTGPEEPASPLAGRTTLNAGEETTLLVLHGDLGIRESRYAPVDGRELEASGVHYAALGHVHAPTMPARLGGTVWAYCGCPEGRGFDELEPADGFGVLLGEVCGEKVSLRRVPVACRHLRQLTVSVTPEQQVLPAIEAALPPGTETDLYRIRLTGRQETQPDLSKLAAALVSRFFYVELESDLRPPEDLWSAAGEPGLRGLFLSELLRRRKDAGPKQQALYDEAARLGLAAMEGETLPEEGGQL